MILRIVQIFGSHAKFEKKECKANTTVPTK